MSDQEMLASLFRAWGSERDTGDPEVDWATSAEEMAEIAMRRLQASRDEEMEVLKRDLEAFRWVAFRYDLHGATWGAAILEAQDALQESGE